MESLWPGGEKKQEEKTGNHSVKHAIQQILGAIP
jgi:hypothetical protein